MKREDLRVMTSESETGDGQHKWRVFRPVSEAELAEMGLVVVPDCEACKGHTFLGEFEHVDPYTGEHLGNELIPCPSCGGSGKDWEALYGLIAERLAALDKGDTE